MGSPLRAMNRNKYFLLGNIVSLVVNIIVIAILLKHLGLIAPAIAVVVAEVVGSIYMGAKIIRVYEVQVATLFFWKKLFTITIVALAPVPILLAGQFVKVNDVIRAVGFSTVYLAVYYLVVRRCKIEEFEAFVSAVLNRTARLGKKAAAEVDSGNGATG